MTDPEVQHLARLPRLACWFGLHDWRITDSGLAYYTVLGGAAFKAYVVREQCRHCLIWRTETQEWMADYPLATPPSSPETEGGGT